MATKKEPTQLDHSIEIYVPTQCRCGELLPEDIRAEILEEVKSSMGIWFGGGSVKSVKKADVRVEPIEGFWSLASGDTANERVDVVYSNATDEALEEYFEEVTSLAADLANFTQTLEERRAERQNHLPTKTQRSHLMRRRERNVANCERPNDLAVFGLGMWMVPTRQFPSSR